MTIKLKEKERIDELHRNGYQIIQNTDGFCFGMDAVLLSGYAVVKKGECVLDMGTGTGIIPILLEAKTEGQHFTGLEIQPQSVDMAKRSVALNHLEEKITIVEGDIKNASSLFGKSIFDVITCNPPYMNENHGLKNPQLPKAIARHELLCSLEDVVREAAYMLRPGGRFYMVHRPRRLIEIISMLSAYKLEVKRLKPVYPTKEKEATMILLEAVRGGNPLLKLEKPVIVYKEPGVYSDEIYEIYGY